jgi:hypothetical protein
MIRFIIILCCFMSFGFAQTKAPKGSAKKASGDELGYPLINPGDTIDGDELLIMEERKFTAYNKRPKTGKDRSLKFCMQLVKDTAVIRKCFNDSLTKNPETFKTIFEKQDGDTNYVLVLVDAFSKPVDKPGCDTGKETKLYFVKWNLKKNRAVWKPKTVGSCMRGVTLMSNVKIADWDQSEPLRLEYHKGSSFYQVMFDPNNYKVGVQAVTDEGTEKNAD